MNVQKSLMVNTVRHLTNAGEIRKQEILSRFRSLLRLYELSEVIEVLIKNYDLSVYAPPKLVYSLTNKRSNPEMEELKPLPNPTKDLIESVVLKTIKEVESQNHRAAERIEVFRLIVGQFGSYFPEATSKNYDTYLVWLSYCINSNLPLRGENYALKG